MHDDSGGGVVKWCMVACWDGGRWGDGGTFNYN